MYVALMFKLVLYYADFHFDDERHRRLVMTRGLTLFATSR